MPRLIWIAGLCIVALGCPSPKPSTPAITTNLLESERPALRIQIAGSNELLVAMDRRWKSVSDQRLDLQSITSEQLLSSDDVTADILISESRWLPTLVERGWISTLPKSIGASEGHEPTSDYQNSSWPLVWRQSATYGQNLWGVPLGVPMMAIVEHAKSQPLLKTTWPDRIVESTPDFAKPSSLLLESVSEAFMLDRFLVISAAMNPRTSESGYMFNLNTARSRLDESWLIEAAQVFAKLYQEYEAMAGVSPDQAWSAVANESVSWALAWPSSIQNSSLTVSAPRPWVDSGVGLVASMTSVNRQSTPSMRFLSWLDEDAQRQEFSRLSSGIQQLPEQWVASREHADVNSYQELLKQGFDDRFVVRELRFPESHRYRKLLLDALRKIVIDPDLAESEFKQCSAAWDQLSEQAGRDLHKRRLAKSLDLEAYRE
ncbi:MAG: hypothetical protein SGI77_15695 [Pirellulaceae bacterium]|nr:hypothetical protein [Pirellulaceae bacterium]